jgi:hypothetical protein
MKKATPLAAIAALFALSACNPPEPEVVDTNPDPMAEQLANAAPVELPPAVKESHSYRCKDNSVVYVDFLADDKSANLRAERTDMPQQVKAENPGEPMTAEGFSLSGMGETVEIAMNGKPAQSCSR